MSDLEFSFGDPVETAPAVSRAAFYGEQIVKLDRQARVHSQIIRARRIALIYNRFDTGQLVEAYLAESDQHAVDDLTDWMSRTLLYECLTFARWPALEDESGRVQRDLIQREIERAEEADPPKSVTWSYFKNKAAKELSPRAHTRNRLKLLEERSERLDRDKSDLAERLGDLTESEQDEALGVLTKAAQVARDPVLFERAENGVQVVTHYFSPEKPPIDHTILDQTRLDYESWVFIQPCAVSGQAASEILRLDPDEPLTAIPVASHVASDLREGVYPVDTDLLVVEWSRLLLYFLTGREPIYAETRDQNASNE